MLIHRLLIVILGMSVSLLAYSASGNIPERILVVGDKVQTNSNYTVLHREQFINKAQTLAELLNQINGIQLRQISGIGNPVAVSIRGSSSKQVQLYIDGQLVNDSQFGGFDLNQIPVEHIQSIELTKDQAVGTGATPMGGVIRINTYNPSKNVSRWSVGIGSFGTRELNATANSLVANGNISLAASHLASDNDADFLVVQPINNPSRPQIQSLNNNQFEKNALSINSELRWPHHQVRVNSQYSQQVKALPLYQNNSPSNESSLHNEIKRFGGNYLYHPSLTWIDQIELQSHLEVKNERYSNAVDGINIGINRYDTDKVQLGIKPTMLYNNLVVTPFIDLNRQEFSSHSEYNGQAPVCNGITACDVQAMSEQWLWGTRVDWEATYAPWSSHFMISQLVQRSENTLRNNTFSAVTAQSDFISGELGMTVELEPYRFTGHLSQGVRMPTLFELYGDRGLFKGNASLQPEQSQTLSFSVAYHQDKWRVNSSIYYKLVDKAIVATFNSAGVGSYGNVNNAQLMGWESQIDYKFNQQFKLLAQMNLIDSQSQSDFYAFNNKKLPNVYHQQLSAAITCDLNTQWSLNLTTEYSQGLYFNLANKVEQHTQGNGNPSDRWVTNLQANWQHNAYSLSISINNLFDYPYQDLANRPDQGSHFFIKFSFEE